MLRDADFLQAIIASPADDAPRLVYADWLEEHGDLARTEFIRLQCELARLPLSDPHILPMRDREAELLTEHYRAWLGPIVDWTELWRFCRGFVEEVSVQTSIFLEQGEKLVQLTPLRQVLFYNLENMYHLARVPFLDQIASLDFRNNQLGDRDVQELTRSPHLRQLKSLGLAGNDLGDEAAFAIAGSANLPCLTSLNLADNHISFPGLFALAQSPYLLWLSRLDLSRNGLGRNTLHALQGRFNLVLTV